MIRTARNAFIQFAATTGNGIFRRVTQRSVARAVPNQQGHSIKKIVEHGEFCVEIYPAMADNYMYIIKANDSKGVIAVDPVDHKFVSFLLAGSGYYLDSILCTHHHGDHDGGNAALSRLYPEIKIYATDPRVQAHTHIINDKTKFNLLGLEIRTLHTPVHTSGHGCFIITSGSGPSAVFVGDTLFHGGAGRFFEGTADQFIVSRDKIIEHVNGTDLMYSGHEYATGNLTFATTVEPNNKILEERFAEVIELRKKNEPTVPTKFELENEINPFFRLESAEIIESTRNYDSSNITMSHNIINTCQTLRDMKNNF